ncbi:hypothetical protein OG963_37465 [Streptomyces sp. NBC_01707]|jgi:hypothetical protein|uniref:hypothetical protein n=1 Tax=unclassified Streptomyces TaxID=2593676 RepID=UPI0008800D76|nr:MULTISPECIES: hypothetical protein [unclassified Streptomyces]MDX3770374.1 hypothetical protein [Streptomyces sp. AK08-01B]MDX3819842.1 hypothetical protein [Streptomyces sp. AK08-01A]SCZ17147.1 hypothetical protein SAMN02745898_1233 [Streptomyces sp. 136MFCol5.1]SFS84792.1 hypothetical protein SAMN04487982_10413 [Streptomyces sp. ok210]
MTTTPHAPEFVVVIPCLGKKLPVAAPAGELYLGSYVLVEQSGAVIRLIGAPR